MSLGLYLVVSLPLLIGRVWKYWLNPIMYFNRGASEHHAFDNSVLATESSSTSPLLRTAAQCRRHSAKQRKRRLDWLNLIAPRQRMVYWRNAKAPRNVQALTSVSSELVWWVSFSWYQALLTQIHSVVCINVIHDLERVREIPCGHIYHSSCLVNTFLRGHNNCPLCRSPILGD